MSPLVPSTNGQSTEEQARSGYSLAQQVDALREYTAREGYEVLRDNESWAEWGEP